MTITDTRPDDTHVAAASASPGAPSAPARHEPVGVAAWLLTGDHKKIGRLFIGASLIYAVAGMVIAALLGIERVDSSGTQILKLNAVGQLFSLYAIGMVFLVTVPLFLGVAICVVPLQVGARTIAFPRAAAASFWGWLVSSAVLIASYIMNGGPGGGDAKGVDLFLVSFSALVIALLLASICVGASVLALRAPGMTIDQTPFGAWGFMVSALLLLLTLPVLLAGLVLMWIDHRYGRIAFGGNFGIGPRIVWAVTQPQIYVYAIPAIAFLAEVAPVFARRRPQPPQGTVLAGAITLMGVLGFGAYVQPVLFPQVTDRVFYKVMVIGSVIPVLVVLLISLRALGRRPAPRAPLLYALMATLLVLAGTVAGALSTFSRLELVGTTWQQGQYELVVIGAGLLGGFGMLVYWGPKIWGKRISELAASAFGVLLFLSLALMAAGNLAAGVVDQPAGETNFVGESGTGFFNVCVAAGAIAVVVLTIAGVLLLIRGFTKGEPAGDDPWEGHTLEWATTSPPPNGNFSGPLPEITSDRPLLDSREAAAKEA
jgi:heme/copper-type cytochrome/quinol oxidase subunit 1